MPRKQRGRKLKPWLKRAKKKQRGGFFPFLIPIGAAIASAISAAAPVVATSALGAATAYGTTKLLTKIGGSRGKPRVYRRNVLPRKRLHRIK